MSWALHMGTLTSSALSRNSVPIFCLIGELNFYIGANECIGVEVLDPVKRVREMSFKAYVNFQSEAFLWNIKYSLINAL